jgi:hypothetical protein
MVALSPTPMGHRRRDASEVRYIGRLMGRYTLFDGARHAGQVFSCRTQAISASEAVVAAPVNGELGERVSANFDEIGMVEGTVSRQFQDGFAFAIDAHKVDRVSLNSRIAWVKKRDNAGTLEKRSHKRVVPRASQSVVILPDGSFYRAFIINMSASGVAISSEVKPEIGLPLAVGSVVGRVVRHFEGGFGIKFLHEQDLDSVETRLVRFNQEWVSKFKSLNLGRSVEDFQFSGGDDKNEADDFENEDDMFVI